MPVAGSMPTTMRATASRKSASSSSPSASFSRSAAAWSGQRTRSRSTASSARAMFQRAITFVKALSSTSSWYSSGPITWRMCRLLSASATARDAQPGRIQQNLRAGAKEEIIVAGGAPVLPYRIGDVGADVVLHLAGQYLHHRAVGHDHALGRSLHAGVGRFPGIKRTLEAEMRCLRARGGQCVETVHQQRPRRLWPDRGVEGQQVDLGVPEDVAEIGVTGERACADRDAVVLGIGGADQMIDGKAQRLLGFIVALDEYVARDPARIPGGLVRGQHGAPP